MKRLLIALALLALLPTIAQADNGWVMAQWPTTERDATGLLHKAGCVNVFLHFDGCDELLVAVRDLNTGEVWQEFDAAQMAIREPVLERHDWFWYFWEFPGSALFEICAECVRRGRVVSRVVEYLDYTGFSR